MTICIILPISLQKKITALRYTSFLAIGGIIYLTFVMVGQAITIRPCALAEKAHYICEQATCVIEANAKEATCASLSACVKSCQGGVSDVIKSNLQGFIISRNIFLALPVFCYGHCSQVQFIPILSDMERPTKKRVTLVIFVAYIIIFSVYSINSLSGYMSFCGYAVWFGSSSAR